MLNVWILGGNAAGMSAAARLSRRAKDTKIYVAEKTQEVSYGACGLPYYIGGFNDDINKIRVRSAEKFIESGIVLSRGLQAEKINFESKQISFLDIQNNQTIIKKYDKLLIATGSSPIIPSIPGIDFPGVYTLKTLSDGAILREKMDDINVRDVVIVGGGYIGLELAEACHKAGKTVRLLESEPEVLSIFDSEFGIEAHEELLSHGVNVHTSEAIQKIESKGDRLLAVSAKGQYETDIIIFSIGTKPNTEFIADDVIKKLSNGALVVNGRMETSVPDVYAAGDCATVMHKLLKEPVYLPLGTNANKQGRFAADVIMGAHAGYENALGTAMLRCITLELAKTGLRQSEAESAGIEAETATVVAYSHPHYYPNAVPITIKICYRKDNQIIIGSQIMGRGDTALRIDVFACAIDRGMTNKELGQLDLGYSPPFSTVWDAVNIAANAIKD